MFVTGRTAWLALAGLVLVVAWPGWGAFWVWLGVCVLLTGLDVLLAPSPRRLTITRPPLPAVRLGERRSTELLVQNTGAQRVRGVLRDAWVPSAGATRTRHRLDLPPAERRRFEVVLVPTRRGDRLADRVTVRTAGPLGLAGRQRSAPVPGRLRVLPPFTSRKHLPSRLARLRELDGRSAVQHRGQGTEFDSLRDYVDGDDVRSIDWRASARRQAVVVRTWRPERDRRVLLVVDTSRTSAARLEGEHPTVRLDAQIEAALLTAALAARAGDRVDLVAHDRRVRARVRGSSRGDLLPALVEALAPLEPSLVEADWDAVATEVRTTARQRALVVLLTALDSSVLDSGLLPVLEQLATRHTVVLAAVDDPALAALARDHSDAEAVYTAAAAETATAVRDRTARLLTRLGVEVVHADPEGLAPALADRYLALKAAGRL
ncbi:DUF58 domain-containing protein [Kineococcus rhizosphaerae]|uniref:Uncharacterized protein (DUF58 family) n=1 Tax=Kineococcus rhizosphaerae TaxID=559628 RepID=A0A2T0R031_9ACTN|nr:DUF58 domain-containing protein [Kineococcus rhizosphaerae]PRY12465.1 uncharacterized protein (DUF58 family) [Kineococcus rhizosphaerae]